MTVFLTTDADTLRERLTKRWVEIGLTAEEVDRKLRKVDLANALFIAEESVTADHRMIS